MRRATVAAGLNRLGNELPAYSGGTAWDLHPLRVVAGQSQMMAIIGADGSCLASIMDPAHTRAGCQCRLPVRSTLRLGDVSGS